MDFAKTIMRRMANIFTRGTFQSRAADGTLTAEQLSGEVHSQLPHPQEFGFASKASNGKTYTIYNGGNRDSGTVLLLEKSGAPALNNGEAAVWNESGVVIKLTAAGTVTITGATVLAVAGNVSDLQGTAQTMQAMRLAYNAHKHGASTTPDVLM